MTGLNTSRKKKPSIKRFLTAALIAMLSISMVTVTSMQAFAANEPAVNAPKEASIDDVKNSAQKVIDAVGELDDLINPKDAESIAEIFKDFASIASSAGSVIGAVSSAYSFLSLIGVVKNAQQQALIDITQQLQLVNEKLNEMDLKLDQIAQQMIKMEAEGTFQDRAEYARDMTAAWKNFQTNYMEQQMDELIRIHTATLLKLTREWIEYDTEAARPAGRKKADTNLVVLYYKASGSSCELQYTIDNTASAEEGSPDRYMILDETFLPAKDEIDFNVNTYRQDLVDYMTQKLDLLRSSVPAAEAGTAITEEHYTIYNMDPSIWTDEDLQKYAEDCVNEIFYRLNWHAVNGDGGDFASKVLKQYGEYCNHVTQSQEGVDALMKTIFLTHAFEFETRDDINHVCNQMLLKTGVYGLFALNVLGMSEYITDKQKQDAANLMCDSIDTLKTLHNNSLTGKDNYCYVTNSIVEYGDVLFTGKITAHFKTRGTVGTYQSYSGASINATYFYDDRDSQGVQTPTMVGDANALVIAYHVASAGEQFDHEYMHEHLQSGQITKRSGIITSLNNGNGRETLPLDSSLVLRGHHVMGSWFTEGRQYTLDNLPDDCTWSYIVYRQGIRGSLYAGGTATPTVNKTLFGTALYGESHTLWSHDEIAFMGGPATDSSFTEETPARKQVDSDFWGTTYYTQDYSNSAYYNILVQVPYDKGPLGTPKTLVDFQEYTANLNTKARMEDKVAYAESILGQSNWTEESVKTANAALTQAKSCLAKEDATAEELENALDKLETALKDLKTVKEAQQIKVSSLTERINTNDVDPNENLKLDAIQMEGAKGDVSFALNAGNDPYVENQFAVDSNTGMITIRKWLDPGTYKFNVDINASGDDSFKAAKVTVAVTVVIGEKQITVSVKKNQNMTVKTKTKTVKASVLKKRQKTVAPIKVTNSKGTVKYKIVSVSKKKYAKKFKINAKNGKITLKKKLPAGTYTVKVRITASGDTEYAAQTVTKSFKIKVKK